MIHDYALNLNLVVAADYWWYYFGLTVRNSSLSSLSSIFRKIRIPQLDWPERTMLERYAQQMNRFTQSHSEFPVSGCRRWIMPPAQFPLSNYLYIHFAFVPLRITSLPIDVKETINRNCVVGFDMWQIELCRTPHPRTHTHTRTINMAKTKIHPLQTSNSLVDHIKSKVASDVGRHYLRTTHYTHRASQARFHSVGAMCAMYTV